MPDYEVRARQYAIIALSALMLIALSQPNRDCFDAPGKPIEGEPTPVVEACN